jgi:hypothetical protein
MLGRGKLGAGKDARFHGFEHSATLTGGRFVLRTSPADSVALALAHLVAEGFVAREDDLDARLAQLGSPWIARAAEIGDAKGSWAKGLVADLVEDTPLEIFNRFQRGIAPTVVMVAARPSEDATTELVLYPHASRKGDPGGAAGAASRVRQAISAIEAASAARGVLVEHEVMNGIRNDGSPASQEMVRKLLDWK